MIEIGTTLDATVERVEPYGLFLNHGTEKVFVLLPETSWRDTRPLSDRFQAGDTIKVLVYRYNYPKRINVGSIRRLHPEENPYRKLSRLEPGTVLRGKVTFVDDREITVDLANGAFGHIPNKGLPGRVRLGQSIDVVIVDVDVEEGRLWLDLSENGPDDSLNGAKVTTDNKAGV